MTERDIELCRKVFGKDWEKCVSPRGRKELQRRVEAGDVEIRGGDEVSQPEPDEDDEPEDDVEDEQPERSSRFSRYSEDEIQEGERYMQSPIDGAWFRVTEWVERPDDRVIAISKTEVDESEVPSEVMPSA